MRTFKFLFFISMVVLEYGCQHNQVAQKAKMDTLTEVPKMDRTHTKESNDTLVQNLTHNELYSIGETRRDSSSRLYGDPSTPKKVFSEKSGDNIREITIKYQNSRIIAVVDRITDNQNRMINNTVFNFDKKNECISTDYWNINKPMTYTFDMYWGSLIKYDVNYDPIEMTSSEKQKIIQTTKASLDSVMLHFPEFKYSFNWK